MPRCTSQTTGPDLFDWSVKPAAPSKSAEANRPPMLPSNLAGSLAHLSNDDFERLLAAVKEEAKRRKLPGLQRVDSPKQKASRNAPSGTASSTGTISAAKANVVRAAFRAGVKPNAIARQFGLSFAVVRELLK
jgi:hypothetical protein